MAKSEKKRKIAKVKNDSRRNIRKIMKNVDLSELTKIAIKNERARKQRIKDREKMVSNCFPFCISFSFFVIPIVSLCFIADFFRL